MAFTLVYYDGSMHTVKTFNKVDFTNVVFIVANAKLPSDYTAPRPLIACGNAGVRQTAVNHIISLDNDALIAYCQNDTELTDKMWHLRQQLQVLENVPALKFHVHSIEAITHCVVSSVKNKPYWHQHGKKGKRHDHHHPTSQQWKAVASRRR